jgi:hypothetical protein
MTSYEIKAADLVRQHLQIITPHRSKKISIVNIIGIDNRISVLNHHSIQ